MEEKSTGAVYEDHLSGPMQMGSKRKSRAHLL